MTTNPIRDAIAPQLEAFWWGTRTDSPVRSQTLMATDVMLGTRLPHLCPDCHGDGQSNNFIIDNCDHPAAPTIAALLIAGELLWPNLNDFLNPEAGIQGSDGEKLPYGPDDILICLPRADWLAALRAVEAPAMSRPREYDKRRSTAIRFPDDMHADLVTAAAERDISINRIVIAAVADFLPRLRPVDEMLAPRAVEATQ